MIRKLAAGSGMRAVHLAASIGIGATCLWLVLAQIPARSWPDVLQALRDLPTLSFVLALLCVGISFLAVGRYDAVAHRYFQTGISTRQACVSGTVAIALGQTLGLGSLTGAIARWRMLPSITMGLAFRLSAFICLTFMAALVVVTSVACLILPAPSFTFWPALAVAVILPVIAGLAFFYPRIRLGRFVWPTPSLLALGSILMWTILDTIAAATALYLLIPGDAVAFVTLLPLFLMALGAALISGTPGGVGPFELVVFTFVPEIAQVELLVGIIGFRAVYYAVPALIAMIAIMRPFATPRLAQGPLPVVLKDAARSKVGVIRQNGGELLQTGTTQTAVWTTGQTLCAMFDPLRPSVSDLTGPLFNAARQKNRVPLLYKCSARTALHARQNTWFVSHVADEAVISPSRHETSTAQFRTLRRKLRSAEKLGVTVRQAHILPLAEMTRVDAAWQKSRGGARGGTMGTFCAAYLSHQNVFLAYQHGILIGFVSFHHSTREWCLDLMRQDPDAPDGTMHMLIHHAIGCAAHQAVPRLSLAAIPACPDPRSRFLRQAAALAVTKSGGPGLRQFKSSFRPRWQPLYAAAPNRALLALGLADIARAVHRPADPPKQHQTHHDDENYEVASRLAS